LGRRKIDGNDIVDLFRLISDCAVSGHAHWPAAITIVRQEISE